MPVNPNDIHSYAENKNTQADNKQKNNQANNPEGLDLVKKVAKRVWDEATEKFIEIIEENAGEDAANLAEQIIDSFEQRIAGTSKLLSSVIEEAENAASIQENSKGFATPFKTEDQLRNLHLKQLTHTWEEIRDGEFSYLMNYDAYAGNSGSGSSGDSEGYSGEYTGTNQEIVWQYLIDKGYSKEVVAGIMGNIHHESGFKPDKVEAGNNNEGYGLIQWSHDRKKAFIKAANAAGKKTNDIMFQLDYLQKELTEPSNWFYSPVYPKHKDGYPKDKWLKSKDIDYTTEGFCYSFERPNYSGCRIDIRKEWAHKYYNEFKNANFNKGNGGGGRSSARGQKLAQQLIKEIRKYNGRTYSQQVRYGPSYDCSSLVQTVIKNVAGIDIGVNTWAQIAWFAADPKRGKKYKVSEARPGDLFYYEHRKDDPYHVSMCVGNGRIFHAADETHGILEQNYMGKESYVWRLSQLE